MNKNMLIVMGGGLMVAIIVAALVEMSLGPSEPAPVVSENKVEILVAARDLKVGDELSDTSMKWQSWPEGAMFSGAIMREEEQSVTEALEGRVNRAVVADEPLTSSILLSESGGNFVAAVLRPGKRAVGIEVAAATMAGGFVTPGDFVDVVLTYRIEIEPLPDDPTSEEVIDRNISNFATETILENVKVLAIDQTAQRESDEVRVGRTVTLEVDPFGSEKLALASEMGELTLALRGVGDDAVTELDKRPVTTDMRMTRLRDQVLSEYQDEQGRVKQQSRPIRIYNGAAIETVPTR